jgi:hypothetical protein
VRRSALISEGEKKMSDKTLARRIAEAVAKTLYPLGSSTDPNIVIDLLEPVIAAELPPECEVAPELLAACEELIAHSHLIKLGRLPKLRGDICAAIAKAKAK